MSFESWNNTIDNNAENFSQINKILWRDCKKFIDEIPKEKQKDVLKALWMETSYESDTKTIRKIFQKFQRLRNTWKNIDEILSLNSLEKAQSEKLQYIESHINWVNIQEQQKSNIKNNLNDLWISNSSTILELLENENNRNLWFILLDTLNFINENSWNIFDWNIKRSNEWKIVIESLHANTDSNHITLKQLNYLLSEEERWIIKPLIENALNEKFLSILDESLRSSTNIEDSKKAVNNIIENPRSLKFFIEYYNYKNPSKALQIDVNHITPEDKKKLEKAIKEEFYENGFITDLTDEEKTQLDNETNNKINYARKNRENFRKHARWQKEWLDPNSWLSLAINYDIWKRLLEKYNQKTDKIDKNDHRVLNYARRNFCKDNKLEWLHIPPNSLKALYEETNDFSNFDENWENLIKFKSHFWQNELQFNNICSLLKLRFYSYLNDAQNKVSTFHSKVEKRKNAVINNIAIGSVLDGIRNIFTNLWEKNNTDSHIQLELDKTEPIELENDSEWLIINWTFRWNPIKIKYDLLTWKVYMNTCMTKVYPWNTIIFWKKEAKLYIWKIEDFSSILENYETDNLPKNSWKPNKEKIEINRNKRKEEFLNSFKNQIKEIWKEIWPILETNQTKNEISINFLKTLGIIDSNPNNNTDKEIQFEEWSDAYRVMEIINNSQKGDLQVFSKNIEILAKFCKRNRGNNEPNPNEDDYKDFTKTVATYIKQIDNEEKSKYENTIYFLEKLKNLNEDNFKYTWEWIISKEYQNPFISIIYEKFTDKNSFNPYKIENFINELKNDKDLIINLSNFDIWNLNN